MESFDFEITQDQLSELISSYPNIGKNSHVGNIAVKVVELFFLSKYPDALFSRGTKGADIEVLHSGKVERYEVKGTVDPEISWQKLKVSSQDCYNCLVEGMVLIRVTNIGNTKMRLHFMKYGVDFTLETEVRYAVKQLKKPTFS
jgi:hypothetical protein